MVKLIRAYRRRAYKSAKILGDVQAVLQGTVVQRAVHRQAGKIARRNMNKVLPKGVR